MRPGHQEQRAAELRVVPDARLEREQPARRPASRAAPASRSAPTRALTRLERVADHGRRGIGVVAVDDQLHARRPARLRRRAEPRRDHEHGARLVAVDHARDLASFDDLADEIEVAGIDERRDQRRGWRCCGRCPGRRAGRGGCRSSARSRRRAGRTPARTAGSAACAGRADLAQLLARDGARSCGPPLMRRSARRRRGTRPRATARRRCRSATAMPAAAQPRGDRRRASTSRERRTACTAVPKMLVFSTSGIASSARIACHRLRRRGLSRIGRVGEDAPSAPAPCRARRAGRPG